MTGPSTPLTDAVAPWPDNLEGVLLARRQIMTSGVLDLRTMNDVAARLMTLDALGDDPIEWTLNVPDGDLDSTFALIDVIDLLAAQVHARCIGRIEGPPLGVFVVCHRRIAAAHTRFRLGDGRTTTVVCSAQQAADFVAQRDKQIAEFCSRIAASTAQPVQRVTADFDAGRGFDAGEALAYGIVDAIAPDASRRPLRALDTSDEGPPR